MIARLVNTFYITSRDWDCYNDCPEDVLQHWLGIRYRRFFFGLHWSTETPFVRSY